MELGSTTKRSPGLSPLSSPLLLLESFGCTKSRRRLYQQPEDDCFSPNRINTAAPGHAPSPAGWFPAALHEAPWQQEELTLVATLMATCCLTPSPHVRLWQLGFALSAFNLNASDELCLFAFLPRLSRASLLTHKPCRYLRTKEKQGGHCPS